MRLAVFDLDNTLVKGEFPELLAREVGKQEELERIVQLLKQGKVTPEQDMKKLTSWLKGMPVSRAKKLAGQMEYRQGAEQVARELKKRGYFLAIISDGYELMAEKAMKDLGFDRCFSNRLEVKKGLITGKLLTPFKQRVPYEHCLEHCVCKRKVVLDLTAELGLELKDVTAVGDGVSDWCMLEMAGTSVGFNPNDWVRDRVDHVVQSNDLRDVLPFFK
jgi:phosphoserine phosphatase